MKTLVCEVSWHAFYRGENATNPSLYIENEKDATNFINLNGFYFGYFNGNGLQLTTHQEKERIDYLIFVSNHPQKGKVIVGWYKHPTILKDCQQHQKGNYYYAICKDEDGLLLDEKDRDFSLDCNGAFEWKDIDRRLKIYLEKTTKRINYRQSDVNKAINLPLSDIKNVAQMIETSILHQQYLNALQITNQALLKFGNLASLIYYKAWILYMLLQYHHAVQLLTQLGHVEAYKERVNYMLGNIFFETEDYDRSIKFLKNVKQTNIDQVNYMLSQAYAMQGQVALAKGAIEKAIIANPNEPVYHAFKQDLKEWNHE